MDSEASILERDFWNGSDFEFVQNYDPSFISLVRGDLLNFCEKEAGSARILEVGCGGVSFFKPEDALSITGLDISSKQLRSYPHRRVEADMSSYSLGESFDVILFPASVHHLPNLYEKSLSLAYTHLVKGGVLAFVEPNLFHPHRLCQMLGLVKIISPGEKPLNPLSLDSYMVDGLGARRLSFTYCNVHSAGASKPLWFQSKLFNALKWFKPLHPFIALWFYGVYRKQ